MKNIKINYKIIKNLNPCQDGLDNYEEYFGHKNTTLLDILESFDIPAKNKIWLAVRVMDRQLVEIFAVDCALAAFDAANAAYAAAAANAAYAAATAANATYDAAAANAAYAAAAAANATYDAAANAAYAAAAANAAYAAAAAANAAYAAAYNTERENQIDALIWLLKNS